MKIAHSDKLMYAVQIFSFTFKWSINHKLQVGWAQQRKPFLIWKICRTTVVVPVKVYFLFNSAVTYLSTEWKSILIVKLQFDRCPVEYIFTLHRKLACNTFCFVFSTKISLLTIDSKAYCLKLEAVSKE